MDRHVSAFKGICSGEIINYTIEHIDDTVTYVFNDTFAKLALKAMEDNDITNMTYEQQKFFKGYMKDAEDGTFTEDIYKQFDKYLGELDL